ncbi:hypothetical protein E2L08_00560 [Palleronia sediminis]|uniref:Uncharacterized protein n=1 Tax=Palleronia sediminis TaxID=2547833 RepID=A0A4R6AJ54_9RHOB|nr:hypothetical protein [Palleronia sediminis]TDL84000.1 hypothetical protein E2L08_00560 [Palleronia sediminis]
MIDEISTPVSGPNPLCPNKMSARARLAELGRILAVGVIRLNAENARSLSDEGGDSFVDFSPRTSGGRRAKRIRIGGIHEASQ